MLIDANILIYAVDSDSTHHRPAAAFMEEVLNGNRRVALPWQSITAFLRIATHPRASQHPLTGQEAWGHVDAWLAAAPTWVPEQSIRTAAILGNFIEATGATGNLIPDAALAALAAEHGLTVVTNDSDFERFPVATLNPFGSR